MFLMDEDDGTEIVRELFDLFLKESGARLPELRGFCAANDQSSVRKTIHFIAGSAANIGMCRLATYFRAIENAIDNGSLPPLDKSSADRIFRHYEQGCADFRAALGL